MKKIKSCTGIWNVEKVLYAINDFLQLLEIAEYICCATKSNLWVAERIQPWVRCLIRKTRSRIRFQEWKMLANH